MELTDRYPFIYNISLRWGEMDALGHLNNTYYFRYAEEARIQLFSIYGLAVNKQDPVGPILAYIDCQFQSPVIFPDTLFLGSWIGQWGQTSMHIHHDVFSRNQDRLVARLKSVVVMITYTSGKKVLIPKDLREAINLRQNQFDISAI